MSCNTIRKDGGVVVTIDRPELWLSIIIGSDGKIIEMEHELRPEKGKCRFFGKVTKVKKCCGGHERPLLFECGHEETVMPVAQCLMCKYHEGEK